MAWALTSLTLYHPLPVRHITSSRGTTPLCTSQKTRYFVFKVTSLINLCKIFKGILCEVPFFGGSALLLSYSDGAMASCNYIPQLWVWGGSPAQVGWDGGWGGWGSPAQVGWEGGGGWRGALLG